MALKFKLDKLTALSLGLGACSLIVGMFKEEKDMDAAVERYFKAKEKAEKKKEEKEEES